MTNRSRCGGFTLVEVLVAVVLLSIGLLGLAKLQFWGVKHTGSAYFRTQATQLANELVERMRANPVAVANLEYALGKGVCSVPDCSRSVPDCAADYCDEGQMAQYDLYSIACGISGEGDQLGVDDLLPGGELAVQCAQNDSVICTVKVCWKEADDIQGGGMVQMTVVP